MSREWRILGNSTAKIRENDRQNATRMENFGFIRTKLLDESLKTLGRELKNDKVA